MHHLLRIEEIIHTDEHGNILWKQENIPNIFHLDGQEYILNVAFNTSSGIVVPTSYYLGLDNRQNVQITDTLGNLSQEPTQNGYSRQAVSSADGFTISTDINGNYIAASSVVTFMAVGGSWGPVINLFLATTADNSGYLISTATFANARTVTSGQSINMVISVGLATC